MLALALAATLVAGQQPQPVYYNSSYGARCRRGLPSALTSTKAARAQRAGAEVTDLSADSSPPDPLGPAASKLSKANAANVTRGKVIRCACETILREEGVRTEQATDSNGNLVW